jgi:hypothetical protein
MDIRHVSLALSLESQLQPQRFNLIAKMLSYTLLTFLSLAPIILATPLPQAFFVPAPGNFPAEGDGDYAGGIFSIPLWELLKYAGAGSTAPEAPKTPGSKTSGSGPYPAQMLTDPSLPGHTIFAPKDLQQVI